MELNEFTAHLTVELQGCDIFYTDMYGNNIAEQLSKTHTHDKTSPRAKMEDMKFVMITVPPNSIR